jgi:hypothetical protein
MAVKVQVKYFNSFWLKKTVNNQDATTLTPTPVAWNILTAYSEGDVVFQISSAGIKLYYIARQATTGDTPGSNASIWGPYVSNQPSWPGIGYLPNPSNFPTFPIDCVSGVTDKNWVIEESRIKGGYNNTSTSYGVRAYLKEDENRQSTLINKLIYSGIYNSTTSYNETNVFSVGEQITKSLDPANGSIQRIYAEDTNLIIFQENKVSGALIDKDAIYSAEGQPIQTSTKEVIGQITPYLGEYGISKNPESFGIFGYRKYFTDKYRNAVLRLSRDGITEISEYGMRDYFRDQFDEISDNWKNYVTTYIYNNVHGGSMAANDPYYIEVTTEPTDLEVGMLISIPQALPATKPVNTIVLGFNRVFTGPGYNLRIYIEVDALNPSSDTTLTFTKYVKDQIVGGYDNHNKNYTVSMQKVFTSPDDVEDFSLLNEGGNTQTLSFDEEPKGWTSLYTYKPLFIDGLRGDLYTFKTSEIWKHYDESSVNRTSFYDVRSDSNITFLFNVNPSIMKNFNTISYEGSNGWEVDSISSDKQGKDSVSGWVDSQDNAAIVKSYEEGKYIDRGVTYRSGFNRKENRYVANLINNSTQAIDEVIFGDKMSGIKGYFVTVKISIDASTDVGGPKELFAVSSNYVASSY